VRCFLFESPKKVDCGTNKPKTIKHPKAVESSRADHTMTDPEVSVAFRRYYMQQATVEFADDLDRVRGAEDFNDSAIQLLVGALAAGTAVFSIEDQRRIVKAGKNR
jgi:ribosome assembly protein 3